MVSTWDAGNAEEQSRLGLFLLSTGRQLPPFMTAAHKREEVGYHSEMGTEPGQTRATEVSDPATNGNLLRALVCPVLG